MERLCTIAGCVRVFVAKGFCRSHYEIDWRRKNPGKSAASSKRYYTKNSESRRSQSLAYKRLHPEKALARDRARYASNPEFHRARWRAWAKNNPEKAAAMVARRTAQKLLAVPAWANKFFISEAYHLAKLRTEITGFKWHVDHIVPLQSDLVCGLHVEHNLRVIPARDNLTKNNRWWPDMAS